MEKKVPVKTLYLLLVIAIGLIVLGVGSTYAIFTAGAEISNPIVFSSNLSYEGDLIETISVDIPANSTVSNTLNITNSSSKSLNYVVWYTKNEYDVEIVLSDGSSSGNLVAGNKTTATVDIKNNESNEVTIILGISSSSSSVVLSSEMQIIQIGELSDNMLQGAALYITNLYLTNNPTQITQANSGDKYYYASSAGLMNDGFDSEGNRTNSRKKGNIRYYGANPDNYIYFNCSDYNNQNDGTCEKWRIIGVFDGKLKIMKDESIGSYAWDNNPNGDTANKASGTHDNNWNDSTLQLLLNGEYYNNMGVATKALISESTWNLGGSDGGTARIYPSARYIAERGTGKHSSYTFDTSWTGNVGLMYASDYGFAGDLTQCSAQFLDYYTSANEGCRTANWMFSNSSDKWTISPYALKYAWSSRSSGTGIGQMALDNTVNMLKGVHPVVYLNSDVVIDEGDGSSNSPYKLEVKTETTLKEHIINLYKNNNPTQITQYQSDGTTEQAKYYYSYMDDEKSWGIMNDGLDSDGNFITDATSLTSGTKGNIRYYGASPNNYIYFNCDDYNNQSDSTCEKWRIIGIVDGKVKILRDESLGDYSWDYTSTADYDNNWHDSTLQVLLNNGYYNNTDGNTYYNAYETTPITINFKTDNKGIKNDETRKMISESTWHLGGHDSSDMYANNVYGYERGNAECSNCTYDTTWFGKIGLMYSSDYGYASDLSLCSQKLNGYQETNCSGTDWLFTDSHQWLITPSSSDSWGVNALVPGGSVIDVGAFELYEVFEARPTLYLDLELGISEIDDGSIDRPYQIVVS